MRRAVDGQAPQQDDWNVHSRQSLKLLGGKRIVPHAMVRQRVVSAHPCLSLAHSDIRPRQIAPFKLACADFQPVIEERMPAIKTRTIMMFGKSLDDPIGDLHFI